MGFDDYTLDRLEMYQVRKKFQELYNAENTTNDGMVNLTVILYEEVYL